MAIKSIKERQQAVREKLAKAQERAEEKRRRQSHYRSGNNATNSNVIQDMAEKAKREREERKQQKKAEREARRQERLQESAQADPFQMGDASPWQPDDRRVKGIRKKLSAAKETETRKQLLEKAQAPNAPDGVNLPSKDQLFLAPTAEEGQLLADLENLKTRMAGSAYQRGLTQFESAFKTQLTAHIDKVVRSIGVGAWRRRYQNIDELERAVLLHAVGLLQKLLGIEAPAFRSEHGVVYITFAPPTGLELSQTYCEDMSFRSFQLDFTQIPTLVYRWCLVMVHQFILTAVEKWLSEGEVALGAVGCVPVELVELWHDNLSSMYFSGEEHKDMYELQPIRRFEYTVATWVRQRGWGIY